MKIETQYKYSVDEECYNDAYSLHLYDWERQDYDLEDDWDLEFLAEKCAENYRDFHDGWEISSWNRGDEPIQLWIWKNENESIKFEIWLEFNPTYSVRKS